MRANYHNQVVVQRGTLNGAPLSVPAEVTQYGFTAGGYGRQSPRLTEFDLEGVPLRPIGRRGRLVQVRQQRGDGELRFFRIA